MHCVIAIFHHVFAEQLLATLLACRSGKPLLAIFLFDLSRRKGNLHLWFHLRQLEELLAFVAYASCECMVLVLGFSLFGLRTRWL